MTRLDAAVIRYGDCNCPILRLRRLGERGRRDTRVHNWPRAQGKPSLEILEVKWKRAEISNECWSSDSCAKIKSIAAESMTMDDFILSLAYQFLHSPLTVHYNNRGTLPGGGSR